MVKALVSSDLFEKKAKPSEIIPWFVLSLIPTLYYGLVGLQKAFSASYVVQDDVRQHVFWMQRFVDPTLFPNDWIADYFQTIAPAGYKAFYYAIAQLGVEPLLLAKLLPLPLGLLTAIYGFWVSFQLFPIPLGAFISTTILTQSLWLEDDLVTATPRAFVYLFFLAFLYYLLKRNSILCVVAIALQSLFYPQIALIEVGVLTLRLVQWQGHCLQLSRQKSDYLLWLAGASITLVLVLLFSQNLAEFGPVVTADQMKLMPEFQPHGRNNYYDPNPLRFWLEGDSGLSPTTNPPIIWLSVLLPIFLAKRHPLTQFLSPNIRVLPEILVPSFVLFGLAHGLAMRLYSPSRFTQHSLRLVMALAAGIVVTLMLDTCRRWLLHRGWSELNLGQKFATGFLGVFLTASIIVPAIPLVLLSGHNQKVGNAPEIYEFFAQQPKDTMVASAALELSNLPTFSQRSIFASWEYALAFHLGYYNQIRQRTLDFMTAQYSPELSEVKQFIERYEIDFFLIEKGAFAPGYLASNYWLTQYQPLANETIARLENGPKPAIARLINRCSDLETRRYLVLNASCIAGAQLR
jgi:hypothetical protein